MQTLRSRVFILALVMVFTPSFAAAHVLSTDGSVGAVMHIDPEDDPIIGAPATFFFEFKDTKGKFSLSDCACIFSLHRGQQTLTESLLRPVNASDILTGVARFTFEQKAVYTVTVLGVPKVAGAFQPFTLTYDVRVAREGAPTTAPITVQGVPQRPSHIVHLIIAFGSAILVVALYIRDRPRGS